MEAVLDTRKDFRVPAEDLDDIGIGLLDQPNGFREPFCPYGKT